MADKKRKRADSRAHTACPRCAFKVHGERGLKMHLVQVHSLARDTADAEAATAVRGTR
jgi:hypothetical protein